MVIVNKQFKHGLMVLTDIVATGVLNLKDLWMDLGKDA